LNVIRTRSVAGLCGFAVAAMVAGCAAPVPRQTQVVVVGAHTPAPETVLPAEDRVWRLSDSDLKALGPLPPQPGPGEAGATPVRYSAPPASSTPAVSVGLGFLYSNSNGYPGYWPGYARAPYRGYYGGGRARYR